MKTKLLFSRIQNCKNTSFTFLIIFLMTVTSFGQSGGITFDCLGVGGSSIATITFPGPAAGEFNGYSYWIGGTDNTPTVDEYLLFVQNVGGSDRWEVHKAVVGGDFPNNPADFGVIFYYSNVSTEPDTSVCDNADSTWENVIGCNSVSVDCDYDGDGSNASVDCDDNDPDRFPGNIEVCDGIDNNCDEQIDEGLTDCVIYEYCNEAKTKIMVCHNGKDICVSINALDAHMAHDDFIGSCANAREGDMVISEENPTSYDVVSWPNPSNNLFNIKMVTPNAVDKVNLNAFDINGRLIHSNIINGNEDYQFGGQLSSGVYFVRLSQAATVKVIKVIKR